MAALLAAVLGGGGMARGEDLRDSFLCVPVRAADGSLQVCRQVYEPCAGDLVFYAHDSKVYRALFRMAHSGPPYHIGIVVCLPDGRPALLEAGPWAVMKVFVLDAVPRMHSHAGEVWVRRLRVPLSPEQSARLTAFALAQAGKPFAPLRVACEGTPLRAHAPLGAWLFGSPRLDHRHWFCSELVVAAACVAGLLDPYVMRPNTIYPRDLFDDRTHDLSHLWIEPLPWSGTP